VVSSRHLQDSHTGHLPTPRGRDGPGAGYGYPAPKKKRNPFLIGCLGILGLIVVLGIIGALAGGGDDEGTGTATDEPSATTAGTRTTEAPAQEAAAGIGDPVRDGKFEFTVSKIECGKSRIGSVDFGAKAQGQFCLAYMKVENIGKEAQTLDASSQYMYGSAGQRFDADTEAAIYLDDSQTFLEQINPGNAVNGIVVFDIPKNAEPASLQLHDSPFSGGATVEL
jgi:Domain of unknown function (DUF4352)